MNIHVIAGLLVASGLGSAPTPVAVAGGESAEDQAFDSAVYLLVHNGECSAAMVSDTVGLTAAHCLDDLKFGQQTTAFFGANTSEAVPHQVANWGLHPGYCRDCDDDRLDLAFIELTLPLEGLQSPAIPLATEEGWEQLMHEGQTLTQVGFGNPQDTEPRQRRRVEVRFDELYSSGREFSASPRDGGSCDGDSGGPVFGTLANGERRLVGIHSRSVGGCPSDWGVSGIPYPSLCWLRDETGFDGLQPGDDDCTLINTKPGGCSVARTRPAPWALAMSIGLGLLGARRRRRDR